MKLIQRPVITAIGFLLVVAGLTATTPAGTSQAVSPATQVGMVDPTQGLWHLKGTNGDPASFYFGNPGDFPIMGDWNCDGIDTPGMYRQSDGYVYLRNSNTAGVGDIRFFFGNPGDIPLAGDWNGNGCDTVSIYRPSEGRTYIINALGANEGGLGAADYWYYFGVPGDKPFVGDFDGDGKATVGLHRESTGLVYFQNTYNAAFNGGTQTFGGAPTANQFYFGDPGDRMTAGDWNADGTDSPGLFRPSNTTIYLRYTNTQGNANEWYSMGASSWIPVSGNFGPLSSGVNVSLSGSTSGIRNTVEQLYLWNWAAPGLPPELRAHLVPGPYPNNRSLSINGQAAKDTIQGDGIAVVQAGNDIILLVSDNNDDNWRVVGARMNSLGLSAMYGGTVRQFLVLGSDATASDAMQSNADAFHWITLKPGTGEGTVTNVSRDTFVPVHYGSGVDKLAITMRGRGPATSLRVAQDLSGIPVEGYIAINMYLFDDLVEGLGGFNLLSPRAFLSFIQGLNFLNGPDALIYARERNSQPSGDVDRQLNHGLEMQEALEKVQGLGIMKLPFFLSLMDNYVVTDLSAADLLTLGASAYQVHHSNLDNIVLQGNWADAWECQVAGDGFLNPRPSDTDCVNTYGGTVIWGWRLTPQNLAVFNDLKDGSLGTPCIVSLDPTEPGLGLSPGACWTRP